MTSRTYTLVHDCCGLKMANDFDGAISYALKRVDCPSLKPEQRDSIKAVYDGKDVFV